MYTYTLLSYLLNTPVEKPADFSPYLAMAGHFLVSTVAISAFYVLTLLAAIVMPGMEAQAASAWPYPIAEEVPHRIHQQALLAVWGGIGLCVAVLLGAVWISLRRR